MLWIFNFTTYFSDVTLFYEMRTSHNEIIFFIHVHEIPIFYHPVCTFPIWPIAYPYAPDEYT
jgi:hypothetical protein